MRISLSVITFVLFAACASQDQGVVWDASTSALGSRLHIEGDRLVLEKSAPGPEQCPEVPCETAQVVIELPDGDFDVRFSGVRLASEFGAVGASVVSGGSWALVQYERDGFMAGVFTDLLADRSAEIFESSDGFREGLEGELRLVRQGDQVQVGATTSDTTASDTAVMGAEHATLTLYVGAFPWGERGTAARAEIASRALSGEMISFADDEIVAEQ